MEDEMKKVIKKCVGYSESSDVLRWDGVDAVGMETIGAREAMRPKTPRHYLWRKRKSWMKYKIIITVAAVRIN
jgi:hypothetical protein